MFANGISTVADRHSFVTRTYTVLFPVELMGTDSIIKVQKFRVAIYGILVEDGKVLVTNTRVPSGIVTNFPGGGLELGESPVDAVAREFREETSMTVSVGKLLYCSQRFHQNPEYPHEQLIHIYYHVHRLSGEIQHAGNNDDVVSAEWVLHAHLDGRRIFDVDREFIKHEAFKTLLLESLTT